MKKCICAVCLLCILSVVLGSCKKKTEITPADDANCTRYEFIQWTLEEIVVTASDVIETTGNKDLFLKLYDNGTAKACIDGVNVLDMKYTDSTIWLVDEPNNKMILNLTETTAEMIDGSYTFQFAKK